MRKKYWKNSIDNYLGSCVWQFLHLAGKEFKQDSKD
jgi:hypothetical protein